jgi:hypothetical protein
MVPPATKKIDAEVAICVEVQTRRTRGHCGGRALRPVPMVKRGAYCDKKVNVLRTAITTRTTTRDHAPNQPAEVAAENDDADSSGSRGVR